MLLLPTFSLFAADIEGGTMFLRMEPNVARALVKGIK